MRSTRSSIASALLAFTAWAATALAASSATALTGWSDTALAAGAAPSATPTRTTTFVPGPCPRELGPRARCGTVEVPEDRATPGGRHIQLSVVVLPTKAPERARDALALLAGGPGQAATEMIAGAVAELAPALATRDLLLVDQRGTGASAPLNCSLYGDGTDLQAALGDFFPLAAVDRCRSALEKQADLGKYTTTIAAADLDDVRAALGYEQLTLFGGSYGTRAALEYLRRYPTHVRAAVLAGVVSPDDPLPRGLPAYSQRSLDGVVAECAGDRACHRAFPRLAREVKLLFERLAKPARVSILSPTTAELTPVLLSRDLAAEALRYLLYSASSAASVPAVVHAAASGDYGPLAEFALFARQQIVQAGSLGMYLSVTCAEDLPFVDPADVDRLARGTFTGDYRYRQQRAACDHWVRGAVPADFHSPVRASVPVLLVAGQWDPATPPALAERVARGLERSLTIVVPSGGHEYHGLEGAECVDGLVARFLVQGSGEGLDTSCVSKVRRAGFVTELPAMKVIDLPAADLAALAGQYEGEGQPFELTIEVAGRALRAVRGKEAPLLLAPVSPTRFRIAGAQGLAVVFDRGASPGPRLTIEQSGKPVLTLLRKAGAAPVP